MTSKEIVKKIKTNYSHRIEMATLRREEIFGSIKENTIFELSFQRIQDENDEDYINVVDKDIFVRVKDLIQVKEILMEMDAVKSNTDDCLYSLAYKGNVDNKQPFILKITVLKSLRL